jgi:hypothetical protein
MGPQRTRTKVISDLSPEDKKIYEAGEAIKHVIDVECTRIAGTGRNPQQVRLQVISELSPEERKIYEDCEAKKQKKPSDERQEEKGEIVKVARRKLTSEEDEPNVRPIIKKKNKTSSEEEKKRFKEEEEYQRKEEEKRKETQKILAECARINEKIECELKAMGTNEGTRKKNLKHVKETKLRECERKFYDIYCGEKSTGALKLLEKVPVVAKKVHDNVPGNVPGNAVPGNTGHGHAVPASAVPSNTGHGHAVPASAVSSNTEPSKTVLKKVRGLF